MIRINDVVAAIRGHAYHAQSEAELQAGLHQVLCETFPQQAHREVQLGPAGRVDFTVGSIAVELKTKGSPASVLRQLGRYASHPGIEAVLLVTTRAQLTNVPSSLAGKPVRAIYLGGMA